jgi:hypothetical protein
MPTQSSKDKAAVNVWGQESASVLVSKGRIRNRRAHDRNVLNMLVRGTRQEIKEVQLPFYVSPSNHDFVCLLF